MPTIRKDLLLDGFICLSARTVIHALGYSIVVACVCVCSLAERKGCVEL